MTLRWFFSAAVRQATDACRHVRRLLDAQRDIPRAAGHVEAVNTGVKNTEEAIKSGADNETLGARLDELEKAAAKWIKPYPNAEFRENVEVFLVAIVVAMAVRTFFLQPFKIPTGSMQPTLWGVDIQDLHDDPDFKMPNVFVRFYDFVVKGEIYHDIIAPDDCRFVGLIPNNPSEAPGKVLGFINKQEIVMEFKDGHREAFTVWCGPDDHLAMGKSGLESAHVFQKRARADPPLQGDDGRPFVCGPAYL